MNNEKQLVLYSIFWTIAFHGLVFLILFLVKFSSYIPKIEFMQLDFENIAISESMPPTKQTIANENQVKTSGDDKIISQPIINTNINHDENDFISTQKHYDVTLSEPEFGEKQNFNFEEKNIAFSEQIKKPKIDSILTNNSAFGTDKNTFLGEVSLTDSIHRNNANFSFDESDVALGNNGIAFKILGDAGKREIIFKTIPNRSEIKTDGRVEILFQLTPNGNVSNLEPGMKSNAELYNLVEKYFIKWQFAPTTDSNLKQGKIIFIFKLI